MELTIINRIITVILTWTRWGDTAGLFKRQMTFRFFRQLTSSLPRNQSEQTG